MEHEFSTPEKPKRMPEMPRILNRRQKSLALYHSIRNNGVARKLKFGKRNEVELLVASGLLLASTSNVRTRKSVKRYPL